MTYKFGDIVVNDFASDENPIKRGIVVRTGNRTGRVNPGPYVELTNGKGKFWTVSGSRPDKLRVVGSALTQPDSGAT